MPLEQILSELKKSVEFKENTAAGDVILIGMKEGLCYGMVLEIKQNVKREWWDVHFKLLVMPPVDMTWILRTPQMSGEIFTINGEEHFMIAVVIEMPRETVKKPGGRAVLSLVKDEKDDCEK